MVNTRRLVYLAQMLTIALALHIIEAILPRPIFPWAKIGLPNVITLVVIVSFGLKEALLLSLLRATIAAIVLGTFMSPVFFLSISGAVVSTVVMYLAYRYLGFLFSTVGISLFGSIAHIFTQFMVANLFFFPQLLINRYEGMNLTLFFLSFSIPSGIFIGFLAQKLLDKLQKTPFAVFLTTEFK